MAGAAYGRENLLDRKGRGFLSSKEIGADKGCDSATKGGRGEEAL